MKKFFMKKLSRTDVTKRLAVPSHFFRRILPAFKGKHFLDLKVEHKSQKMECRCSKRKKGEYPKPVKTKGWLEFVKCEELKVGDKIALVQEEDEAAEAQFKIQVHKKIRLLGKDAWTNEL